MKNRLWIIGIVIALAVVLVSGVSTGGINSSGPIITTISGISGEKTISETNDSISAAVHISFATSITTDRTNLYAVNTFNNTIQKVVIPTGEVFTLAGTEGLSGSTDGAGAAAFFNHPQGITTDGTNFYIADTSNCAIRKVVIATEEVSTLAGTAGTCGSTDGTGLAAQFDTPYGITTDGTNLYVTDTYNGTIRQIVISTGVVTTLAGSAKTIGFTDGIGAAARFNFVTAITTDGTNLYVVDNGNRTIRKTVIATGEVTTLAGTAGISGSTDGTGPAAQFGTPYGITTDGTNLYVTDTYNGTIRQIVISTGVVTTLAGSAKTIGFTDGIGAAARFNFVTAITTDGTNLYVVDNGNRTIRKIVIATGEVTTLAGTAGISGSTDGTGPAAQFGTPHGITTDVANLYVTDMDKIYKIR